MIDFYPLSNDNAKDAAEMVVNLAKALHDKKIPTLRDLTQTIFYALEDGHYQGTLAYDDNTVVGYIGMNKRTALYAGGDFIHVTELYVLPDYRKKGLGGRLLAQAELAADILGTRKIDINIPNPEDHPQTFAFYEGQGYEIANLYVTKTH